MTTSRDWVDLMGRYAYNPTAIARLSFDLVEQSLEGTADIINPSNPFVQTLTVGAVTAAAAMQESAINTRKLYRSLAQTPEDLYLHMSDRDYVDRFATPARSHIQFFLAVEEVRATARPTGSAQVSKLTIPRHTRITVNRIDFTLQYPIDIRVMGHQGLQIVYDNTSLSPLQTLSTNLVDWEIINIRGVDYVMLTIPVSQFRISSFMGSGNLTQNFVKRWTFTQQFYYARAFYKTLEGQWIEMLTTHTEQVFDPQRPTAVLKVEGQTVQMTVPQVYATTGRVTGDYRLDIYTTLGPVSMSMADYGAGEFQVEYEDLEGSDGGFYTAPMNTFSNMFVLSDAEVSGGSNAMTFSALRERSMNSVQTQDLPITNVHFTDRLARLGYDAVTNVDNITTRQFLATRELPAPANGFLSSGAACTIQTLITSMSDIATLETAADNGDRVTFKPSTLFRLVDGLVEVVPKVQADALLAQPLEVRARRINEGQYLYTPFHYVLDRTGPYFEHRPYYLDDPKVLTKSFVEENATTAMQVAIDSYSIERVIDGYRLTLFLTSSQPWKDMDDEDVFVQLSYIPVGQEDRAYLNGTLLGTVSGERVYQFDLVTNYDLDALDNIGLTSFSMYSDEARTHFTPLTADFDIMYAVSNYFVDGLQGSNIDQELGQPLLPSDALGVSRERLSIQFGEAMRGLWAASRTVASEEHYERYETDIPSLYDRTIFKTDATGAIEMSLDDDGQLQYVVLHRKGDPVLLEDGTPVIRFKAGEVRLDAGGQPVVKSSRSLLRHIDLMFVDGVYWFANQAESVMYRQSIPKTIAAWLRNDITYLSQYLLEQTHLYFYPKATFGQVRTIIRESQESLLPAAQSFNVTYYLNATQFRDAELRVSLTATAVQTIAAELRKGSVSMAQITSRLTAAAGNDIISVEISGLGGSQQLAMVTLLDDSARLSIKKLAVAYSDGTVGIEDAVVVSFIRHISL